MRRGALVGILLLVFWFAGRYLAEEAIFHPIVPVVGALALIVVSMRAMVRDFRLTQVLLGSFVILACLTSLFVVKRTVLDRAMGTYLAHYLLLAAIPLATAQHVLSSRRLRGGE